MNEINNIISIASNNFKCICRAASIVDKSLDEHHELFHQNCNKEDCFGHNDKYIDELSIIVEQFNSNNAKLLRKYYKILKAIMHGNLNNAFDLIGIDGLPHNMIIEYYLNNNSINNTQEIMKKIDGRYPKFLLFADQRIFNSFIKYFNLCHSIISKEIQNFQK